MRTATSAASTQATATTQARIITGYVSINAGGPAVSNSGGGDNSFVADEDYSSGGTTYSVTNAITIPASIAATAAPAAVYQDGAARSRDLYDSWPDPWNQLHCSSALCRALFLGSRQS